MSLPKYGTAPIKCAKRGCKWRGYETQLAKKSDPLHSSLSATRSICPSCGYDSYLFMTEKEITAWEKEKQLPLCAVGGTPVPGGMCGRVIVGLKYCGSADQCEHQRNQEQAA